MPGGMDVVLHGQGPQPTRSPDPPSRLRAMATRLHGTKQSVGKPEAGDAVVADRVSNVAAGEGGLPSVVVPGGRGDARGRMQVFPKGRIDEELRAMGQPVTRPLAPAFLPGGRRRGVSMMVRGLGAERPPLLDEAEPGICAMCTDGARIKAKTSPGPWRRPQLTLPSLCICSGLQRTAESRNQDTASRWPALCIGLVPI